MESESLPRVSTFWAATFWLRLGILSLCPEFQLSGQQLSDYDSGLSLNSPHSLRQLSLHNQLEEPCSPGWEDCQRLATYDLRLTTAYDFRLTTYDLRLTTFWPATFQLQLSNYDSGLSLHSLILSPHTHWQSQSCYDVPENIQLAVTTRVPLQSVPTVRASPSQLSALPPLVVPQPNLTWPNLT